MKRLMEMGKHLLLKWAELEQQQLLCGPGNEDTLERTSNKTIGLVSFSVMPQTIKLHIMY